MDTEPDIDSSDFNWGVIYYSLIHSIRSNTGYGFHNSDQGHIAYVTGAQGVESDYTTYGDSPEHNSVFKILTEISRSRGKVEDLPVIDNWKDFCQLAIDGYYGNKNPAE